MDSSSAPLRDQLDLRILQFVVVLQPRAAFGGPVTVAINQTVQMRLQGAQVDLLGGRIGPGDSSSMSTEGHVLRLQRLVPHTRFSGYGMMGLSSWLTRRHRDAPYDLAHLHVGRHAAGYQIAALLRRKGIPFIVQTHGMLPQLGGWRKRIDKVVTGTMLRSAKSVLALSDSEAEHLSRQFRLENILVMPNGVPASKATPPSLLVRPIDILYVGRLHARKRVQDLITAVGIVRNSLPNVTCLIVGPDEGVLAGLRTQVNALGLERNITFQPPVDSHAVQHLLQSSQCYVLPSVDEPFPMALLEALANRTPVICTVSTGIYELLSSYGAAIQVSPCEPTELGVAIQSVLTDAELSTKLADNGLSLVEARLSMTTIGQQLGGTYRAAVR